MGFEAMIDETLEMNKIEPHIRSLVIFLRIDCELTREGGREGRRERER